jgi:nicotinamide riboside kinase
MSTAVYTTFIKKVLFLGGESTGKTTLCKELSTYYHTVVALEYGRELYERRAGNLMFEDMEFIGKIQLTREERLQKIQAVQLNWHRSRSPFIFCDTSPLTTLFYSEYIFHHSSENLINMATDSHYDIIFLCAPDFPIVQDGTRQDETFRQSQHDFYVKCLDDAEVPYIVLTGTYQDKLDTVKTHLGEYI